jgi:predicted nucleotidyltransferase
MINSVLEKAFPGLYVPPEGTLVSRDEALRIAHAYVIERYPQCRSALLFGSYARGQQKRLSDLDILIFLPEFEPGQRAEILRAVYGGLRVEAFLFTEETFLDALVQHRMFGMLVYHFAILEGVLLAGSEEFARNLKDLAQRELLTFQNVLEPAALSFFRIQMTNQLVKLSCAEGHFDRVQYASILFNSICMAVIKAETGAVGSFERLPKMFREHDPEGAAALQEAYLKIVQGGDVVEFLNYAAGCLDRIGGPCWQGVTEPLTQKTFSRQIKFIYNVLWGRLKMRIRALCGGITQTARKQID